VLLRQADERPALILADACSIYQHAASQSQRSCGCRQALLPCAPLAASNAVLVDASPAPCLLLLLLLLLLSLLRCRCSASCCLRPLYQVVAEGALAGALETHHHHHHRSCRHHCRLLLLLVMLRPLLVLPAMLLLVLLRLLLVLLLRSGIILQPGPLAGWLAAFSCTEATAACPRSICNSVTD
jgi:hypothetical protein